MVYGAEKYGAGPYGAEKVVVSAKDRNGKVTSTTTKWYIPLVYRPRHLALAEEEADRWAGLLERLT